MAKKRKSELPETVENNNILLEEKMDMESIRNELKDYIDESINEKLLDELDKTNKKLLREKSKKIIWKNIIIIVLLLIIGFLLYLLFSNNYFDKFFNHSNDKEITEKDKNTNDTIIKDEEPNKEEVEKPKKPTLEELKLEYGHLLENYYVTNNSIYLNEFYNGNLTDEMMKYITLNSFDFSTIEKVEDYNIIKESTFVTMFNKLFDKEYNAASFKYDDNNVRYVKQMESYMTTSTLIRDDNNIKKEIKDINIDGDLIIISTVEGIITDNKLINILTNEEVPNYQGDSLLKYADKLNQLTYTFKTNKLVSLNKLTG